MADAVNNTDEAPKKDPVTPPELKEAVGITPGGLDSAAAVAKPATAQATPATEAEKPAETDPKAQNAKPQEENEEEKARKKRLKEQQAQQDAAVNDEQDAKARSKKPEEQNAADATPQQEKTEPEQAEQQQSRFVKLGKKDFDVLHRHPAWNTPYIDPTLHEVMDQGSIRKGGSGLNFKLNNDHTVQWRPDIGKSPTSEGTEFIGIRTGSFRHKFDETDAKAVVALAKMRGWSSLRIHGPIAQKDLMWIEAQRQGLPVKGYEPTPETAAKWAKEAEERAQKEADKHLTGGTDGEKPIPTLTEDDKKGIDKTEPKTPKAKTAEDSNFVVGATGKPKKLDELSKMARAPFKAGPKEDETVDQYLDRKIATSKNSDVKQGFLQIKAALNNGELQMGEIDMTKLLRDEVSGKSVAEELKSVRKVVGGLGVTINDSIEKVDLAAAAPETPKKVAPAVKAGAPGMS